MKVLAADDESLALDMLVESIQQAIDDVEVFSFSTPSKLLAFDEIDTCDIAFLDIQMRGMSGIELAKRLKDLCPKLNIIFVTGYDEYALEAMKQHVSGYITKPVTAEKIKEEIKDLRYPIREKKNALLKVKCFGNFEVFDMNGNPIHFERSKSKEMFAYLIYRSGSTSSTREIAAALFEDDEFDKKQIGYIQKIVSSLKKALKNVGAEKVLIKGFNSFSINVDLVDCDYYRFATLDRQAVNSYNGEFMSQYSWGEFVTGYLERMIRKAEKED